MRIEYERIWHIDEKFIKVRGSKEKYAYLFVVIDRKHKIITVYVAETRTTKEAKKVLKEARSKVETLEIIVTDKCQIYEKVCKMFGRRLSTIRCILKASV